MTNTTLNKIAKYIGISSIILSGIGAISLCLVLKNTWSMQWSFNTEGLNNLYTLSETPIKFFVGSFAVFAAWLTLGRMEQTERQLEITTDNNKFTNYYRHTQEYLNFFMKEPIFIELKKYNALMVDPQILLLALYRQYYYATYTLFVPHCNPQMHEYINSFRTGVRDSVLNRVGVDFSKLQSNDIPSIENISDRAFIQIVESLCRTSLPHIQRHLKTLGMPPKQINEEAVKFFSISVFFWLDSFYYSILVFDGDMGTTLDNLADNYGEYIRYLGLR
jgi:hypothetical protein